MSDLGSGDEGSNSQKYHGQVGMESGNADFDSGQQGHAEQELATKMLQIQSKRFYLDVKQNRRGRFIKVAEIGADGRRSQIFLALSTAAEFRDHLSTFSDFYASLGPPNPDNVPEDGKLKSEMMIKDNRRYYLDLKENTRGRFLRVSQTITRGGPRSQVAIPAQGMIEFRDALTDLLDEFSTDEHGYKPELPEGRHMHVDNKNFYFDIGQNNRGIYMRISEVKTNFRTAITVPEKSWCRFRDILADYCEKIKQADQIQQPMVGSNSQQDSGTSLKHRTVPTNQKAATPTIPPPPQPIQQQQQPPQCERNSEQTFDVRARPTPTRCICSLSYVRELAPPIQSFFGFGQSADIDIRLDGADTRKTAEIKTEDGKKERLLLYYDGETVSGTVNISLRKAGSKLEHHGIKIEFIGQIELFYDRGNHHEFTSLVKELARPGEMITNTSYRFEFACVEKPFEVYTGSNVRLRYFLRVTVVRRLADLVKELDIAVHTLSSYPEMNNSIKMEVGIEDCLHIEFEYNKSKYHLKDVIVGKIYFLLVRIKIKHMEIAIIKRETTGMGNNIFTENETIAKYEIMDGAPVRGESIPIRVFLAGYELTPTMRDINKKFSVRYFLNLVLMDTEDRRYFKQQEITLWRKGEKQRKSQLHSPHLPSHLVNSNGNLIDDSGNQNVQNDVTPNAVSSESESNENQPHENSIENMKREEADGQTANNDTQR